MNSKNPPFNKCVGRTENFNPLIHFTLALIQKTVGTALLSNSKLKTNGLKLKELSTIIIVVAIKVIENIGSNSTNRFRERFLNSAYLYIINIVIAE